MATTIKRSQVQTFLNITPSTGLGNEDYALIGDGVKTGKIDYKPKVTDETYISDDSATITVDSYAPTMPVSQIAKQGDEVFDFIDSLRIARAILGDAETDIVNVWLYETPDGTLYPAEQQKVSIQIDSFGGDGGAAVSIEYTINFIGDPIVGKFDTADSSFTAGA
jgi:hypothetical protein